MQGIIRKCIRQSQGIDPFMKMNADLRNGGQLVNQISALNNAFEVPKAFILSSSENFGMIRS